MICLAPICSVYSVNDGSHTDWVMTILNQGPALKKSNRQGDWTTLTNRFHLFSGNHHDLTNSDIRSTRVVLIAMKTLSQFASLLHYQRSVRVVSTGKIYYTVSCARGVWIRELNSMYTQILLAINPLTLVCSGLQRLKMSLAVSLQLPSCLLWLMRYFWYVLHVSILILFSISLDAPCSRHTSSHLSPDPAFRLGAPQKLGERVLFLSSRMAGGSTVILYAS